MDLRIPLGLLLLILGALVASYGLVTRDTARFDPGFNVNLWWGIAMFLFGALIAGAAKLTRRRITGGKESEKSNLEPFRRG